MKVHSEPISSTGRQSHKESAVVSHATLRRQRGHIERWTAWGVLVLSFLGTIVAFHGGWGPIIQREFRLSAILGGLLSQGILTWLQWSYPDRRIICQGSRLIDMAFTAYGYGPLFVGSIAALLIGAGVSGDGLFVLRGVAISTALFIAWYIFGLVSYLAAWYPESRLID